MKMLLRPASIDDADLLLTWFNSPDSLAAKKTTRSPISRAGHVAWFTAALANGLARIWIIEQAGRPVGQVHLAPDATGRRLTDVYVVAAHRKAGVARAALELAIAQAQGLWPGEPVYAEVLPSNTGSRRLFESIGFRLQRNTADLLVYAFECGRR